MKATNGGYSELEFLKSLWELGTKEEEGYRTGPPGYIDWRNSFLGIDSGIPYNFKNTGSVCPLSNNQQVDTATKRSVTQRKRHIT